MVEIRADVIIGVVIGGGGFFLEFGDLILFGDLNLFRGRDMFSNESLIYFFFRVILGGLVSEYIRMERVVVVIVVGVAVG